MEERYVEFAQVEPFAGSSFIPLPKDLGAKKAIVNVKNADNECFRWALKSARFPVEKNAERPSRYPANDGLSWEGVAFPVKVPQIGQFEKQNEGLAINVFGWESGGLTILRVSPVPKNFPRTNLMLIIDGEKSHYCWIKNLGRLLNDKSKDGHQQFHCDLCLSRFTNEKVLEKHQEVCEGVDGRPTRIEMPVPGSTLKFKNHHKQQKAPYVIYADFESIIKKLPEERATAKTEKMPRHVGSGYAYTVVRSTEKVGEKCTGSGMTARPPRRKII